MQTMRRNWQFWTTPVVGVAIGVAYLIGFSIGGRPGDGVIGLLVMVAFSAGIVLLGQRSETVRGLLDQHDERITGIGLRATAATAIAMIAAVLIGFVTEIAHGHSGNQFAVVGAVGGLAYLAAVVFLRLRA